MPETTLASFTVDKEKWEAFKKLASQEGRSASNCLNQLIEQALYKNAIDVIGDSDSYITLSDFVSRAEYDQELNNLKSQLADLRQKINQACDFKQVSDMPNLAVKENISESKKQDNKRQEILDLMGYIPTCPECGIESLRKDGHTKTKNSQRFKCINSACSRKTFTVYPKVV